MPPRPPSGEAHKAEGQRASSTVTECSGCASRRKACHSGGMLSQAGDTRPGPYRSSTGRTDAPARNAPVRNGSR